MIGELGFQNANNKITKPTHINADDCTGSLFLKLL